MGETGYVYYGHELTTAARAALLAQVGSQLTAVVHHSANEIAFSQWPVETLLATGQAFGPELEVRWWPAGAGLWEMLLLSETAQAGMAGWDESEMVVDAPQTIWLWGNHWHSLAGASAAAELPDGWVQAEIEADLHYPVNKGGAQKPVVRAQVKTYRQAGIARLTRFVAINARED